MREKYFEAVIAMVCLLCGNTFAQKTKEDPCSNLLKYPERIQQCIQEISKRSGSLRVITDGYTPVPTPCRGGKFKMTLKVEQIGFGAKFKHGLDGRVESAFLGNRGISLTVNKGGLNKDFKISQFSIENISYTNDGTFFIIEGYCLPVPPNESKKR